MVSLPEMAVSISASSKQNSQIAVSNVIGSNIFNICLVLGFVFILSKNLIPKKSIFKDSSWIIYPIILFLIMGYDGKMNF